MPSSKTTVFSVFDFVLITYFFILIVAYLSPAEIEEYILTDYPFVSHFFIILVIFLLALICLWRGFYPLLICWKRSLFLRLLLALTYTISVFIGYSQISRPAYQIDAMEHRWNWIRSLRLTPVSHVTEPYVCVNVIGKGVAILFPRKRFLQWCESRIIQYDLSSQSVCSTSTEAESQKTNRIPDSNPEQDGRLWSEFQIANSFTSVITCSSPYL